MPTILQSIRCERANNDRRRWPRIGLRERISFVAVPGRPAQVAWLRDVSEGGAGLLLPLALQPEQQVVLHLPVRGRETAPVTCRVVHCNKIGSFWRCGVEFVNKPWRDPKHTIRPSALDLTDLRSTHSAN